ncbi:adenylyl-sulfate kinase [Nocardia sp. NPDC004340]
MRWAPNVNTKENDMRCTIWLTGLPSSGKTTLAAALCERFVGVAPTEHLDGDALRADYFPELGFTDHDRRENIRRIGDLARRFANHAVVPVVSVIAPFQAARQAVRAAHEGAGLGYIEVFVDTPLEVCRQRDVKGLYRLAADGNLAGMTGVQSAYEAPAAPDLRVDTSAQSIDECVSAIAALAIDRYAGDRLPACAQRNG